MGSRMGLSTVVVAFIAVAACSDHGTAPDGRQEMAPLVGAWEVVSHTWNGNTTPYPEGSAYWHFKSDGRHCSEATTGHGLRSWACGEVAGGLILTELYPSGVIRKSQLVLAADGDSLRSLTLEATGPVANRYDLVRSMDRDTVDCTCE